MIVTAGVLLAILLPIEVEAVELAAAVQLIVVGVVALFAGAYIWRVNRGLTRDKSEYLWFLVRRDLRVTLGFAILAALAVATLLPRILDIDPWISRPWGTVWLVIGVELFAVGLIDDALQMHRDRNIP